MEIDFYTLERNNRCFLCVESGNDPENVDTSINQRIDRLYKSRNIVRGEDYLFLDSDRLLNDIENNGFSIVCIEITFQESH